MSVPDSLGKRSFCETPWRFHSFAVKHADVMPHDG
jgi:hypothetical protein